MADPPPISRSATRAGIQQIRAGPKVGTIILAIGGVGTTPPEHWTNSDGDLWLGTLNLPDIGLLAFPNRLAQNGLLTCDDVEEEGAFFLAELQRLAEDETVIRSPMVLVAHGLGGIILKRALCLAKQNPKYYRTLMRKIAGFVFMGCPHSSSQDPKEWGAVDNLLQKFTKTRKNSLDAQCAYDLATDCDSFRSILAENAAYVLTITERKGMMSKPMSLKKVLLVDKASATIGHNLETVIEEEANHRDLCMIPKGSKTPEEFIKAFQHPLSDARAALAKGSPRYNRPSVFDASTYKDHHSSEEDGEDENPEFVIRTASGHVTTTSELSSANHESWTKKATTGSDKIKSEVISALKDFTIHQRDPILPCMSIPLPRDPFFSGREDTLARIRQTLLPRDNESENSSSGSLNDLVPELKAYSLCGPGGMGKTSIANEFVHRYGKEFDAVLWVAADEDTKIFNSFREIALKLGIVTADEGKDLPAIRETLLGWLANPLKTYEHMDHVKPDPASWLIVYDNVDRADTLEDFWPKEASGSVLVTCRNPLIKNSIFLRNMGIVVPELMEEEGVALLLRLTSREGDEDDIKQAPEVVRALGQYPLAIAQMSGIIQARDLSFQEFLNMYSKETERKEILGISEPQSSSLRRYNQTLGTVWALDDLMEGKALLQAISLLDPDSIPESLFENNPACADWDRFPNGTLEYSKARGALLSRSLIYRNRDKKNMRIHRLIQDTVRAQMNDATYNEVYSRSLDMLIAQWPRVFKGFGNVQTDWQKNAELWPHVLSIFRHQDRFDPVAPDLDTALKRMEFTLDVMMFSIADSRFSASPTTMKFFTFLRDAIQEENPNFKLKMTDITFHYLRGELGMHTNDREYPLPDFGQCVDKLEKLLDDDAKKSDSFYGATVNELGCAFMMNWRYEEALAEFEKSATILRNMKNPSAQETTMALINMGYVYGYLGRYEEASQIFDVALKARFAELGEDDYSSFVNGKLYMGWGNVRAAQGRFDESFRLHVRCLEHYKRSVGNLHHRTGDGCVKASDHFSRTGDTPTALALLGQALKIFNMDAYHRPEAARAHYKKGNVLQRMELEDGAKVEFDLALDIFNSIVPLENRVESIDELDVEDFDHWIMFWSC